jgi:hypothetical protein
LEASYAEFSGTEVQTVRAGAGEMLVLQYAARVNRATLTIEIEGPEDETLCDMSLGENAEQALELPMEGGGDYTIVVRGDGTAGNFSIRWKVE